jgi:2-oxoglutarate dehydrogenase E1 component
MADSMKLVLLIRSYQVRGHCIANLDPLNMDIRTEPAELKPSK